MRRSLVLLIFAFIAGQSVFAQLIGNSFYVNLKDGMIEPFLWSSVDSIAYTSEKNTNSNQKFSMSVYSRDKKYVYLAFNVDSVSLISYDFGEYLQYAINKEFIIGDHGLAFLKDAMHQNNISVSQIVNDKLYSFIKEQTRKFSRDGIWECHPRPSISIHDDDAIDIQIPVSCKRGATDDTRPTTPKQGGYASILWPILKSLSVKYADQIKGKLVCGIAAEGQRIGLTPLYGHKDEFMGSLNLNGRIIKRLVEHEGWEVMCHSMTARYIAKNYYIDGLESDFANEVLQNGTWNGDLHYGTTTCYNAADGKNYQISQDKTRWTELPLHYAKPYCAVSRSSDSKLVINPTYSAKYQIDTWFERAKLAGLPYFGKVGVKWGSSQSIWHMRENLKYADVMFSVRKKAYLNCIPMDTNPVRISYTPNASRNGVTEHADYYNVYTEKEYKRLTNMIDKCVKNNAWIIFVSHFSTTQNYNGYWQYFDYPTNRDGNRLNYRDDNYPSEWMVPLNYDELISMDEHNYWDNPPARLGISSWDDWYPCPGTTGALLYDALVYAIKKGVWFISSEEGLKTWGNVLSIGLKNSTGENWPADSRLGDIPEQDKSYLVIGADGSVDFKGN